MISQLQHLLLARQSFGTRWLSQRIGYSVQARLGVLRRRTPVTSWSDVPLRDAIRDKTLSDPAAYCSYRRTQAPPFFFSPNDRSSFQSFLTQWDADGMDVINSAQELIQGNLKYFEKVSGTVGTPPNWFTNPFTGESLPGDHHWSEISDFGKGDIKIIWEPNRFGFAYLLVRAYWRTGNEQYAEYFWQCVEDWQQKNPPNQGVNWKCGQEISFRVMAWCFGLYGFLQATATTAQRVTLLAQMMAASGKRIEANIEYALRQQNNHGISESVGLWTIGLLFPELNESATWAAKGRKALEVQAEDLIYEDGAFSQHSVNYHRVMLHDYLWAIRLGDLNGCSLSRELKQRVSASADFLYQLQDNESGCIPNYGQNDGALILPLTNCDYQDFRPVIQSVRYLSSEGRSYEPGLWDEEMLWMFGERAIKTVNKAQPQANLQATTGGYYTLRSKTGFVFIRCANFQDRPGQADMLHLDLWWKGQNIACDAGSYSYNAPPPWNNSLAHTAFHNTATVDSLDQMERVGKFLWLPWLKSKVTQKYDSTEVSYFEGEHDGYQRLKAPVIHRRGVIRIGEESWIVLDKLSSVESHNYRLHWLFPDLPYDWNNESLKLQTPVGEYFVAMKSLMNEPECSLVRADQNSPRGWRSLYYFHREPALSLGVAIQAESMIVATLFSPQPGTLSGSGDSWQIHTNTWNATLQLNRESNSLLRDFSISGAISKLVKL
jgi:Heparinase II/III-like protein/Heparinase II/III N-terminus